MTTAVVPMACHKMDILFKYLRMCTPKVFIMPDEVDDGISKYSINHDLVAP